MFARDYEAVCGAATPSNFARALSGWLVRLNHEGQFFLVIDST